MRQPARTHPAGIGGCVARADSLFAGFGPDHWALARLAADFAKFHTAAGFVAADWATRDQDLQATLERAVRDGFDQPGRYPAERFQMAGFGPVATDALRLGARQIYLRAVQAHLLCGSVPAGALEGHTAAARFAADPPAWVAADEWMALFAELAASLGVTAAARAVTSLAAAGPD